eukprot:TRINITY_DN17985_c0_g1_i1.p1 TRINITY_DN17985_c0_g1~~TRINITY_DN17985_c0_g1_i1.p1  ORF type:complete len:129 (+),score=9.59 TRINITY_DN17985_c0_g1_i1:911-1297(+)
MSIPIRCQFMWNEASLSQNSILLVQFQTSAALRKLEMSDERPDLASNDICLMIANRNRICRLVINTSLWVSFFYGGYCRPGSSRSREQSLLTISSPTNQSYAAVFDRHLMGNSTSILISCPCMHQFEA